MEGNEFGDECCRVICEMLRHMNSVLVVNLSKCAITDVGAEYLGILLRSHHSKLKALLIHWNKIMGRGAVHLAKAIENNDCLQIFDASFNSFGSSTLKNRP